MLIKKAITCIKILDDHSAALAEPVRHSSLHARKILDLLRHDQARVIGERQAPQLRQSREVQRKLRQLVALQVELLEVGKAAQPIWECLDPIVSQPELLQAGQLANLPRETRDVVGVQPSEGRIQLVLE